MILTPPTVSDEALNELFLLIKAGEPDAKQKLILATIKIAQRLAINISKTYRKISVDDFEAEALYLLTMAIEAALKSIETLEEGIAQYITTYVRKNLIRYSYAARKKQAPASWKMKKNLEKGEADILTDEKVTYRGEVVVGSKIITNNWFDNIIDCKELFRKEMNLLIEVVESVVTSPLELRIFKMCLFGMDNQEITDLLEMQYYRVVLIKRNLREKFQKRLLEIEQNAKD